MRTELAVDVTGQEVGQGTEDATLARTLLDDLRATQARLEAALEDAASLKVLLALRTQQHDLAWQEARRLEADLAAARSPDAGPNEAAADALARAQERFAAIQTVLGAVLCSVSPRALDRRRFQDIIAQASRETPDWGPGAERHAVLLAGSRRVLGVKA